MIEIVKRINEFIWGFPLITLIGITSIYLSIKFKFPQFKIFAALKEIFNNDNKNDNNKNRITSFKSLMTILSGTIGTGNITGVATAIVIGGVGSLFWLFISGILVMVISYVENLIVLKYRKKNNNGYFGGTMYILDEILGKRKLAIFFSIALIITAITTGTMTQSNSLSTIVNTATRIDKKVIGLVISLITMYIIFGGKRRLAKVSSIIIPICSITYVILCIYIIYINRNNLISGIINVINSAFNLKQVVGGITGISITRVIGRGFSIGMFSNEAGMGSTPIFTATVEEQDIDLQARIAATSVIIDTLILCVLTGLTITSTGLYYVTDVNILLKKVFSMAPLGYILLNICIAFFVIGTIPCWEYYGEMAVKYVFKGNIYIYIFRILYVIGIYIGSILSLTLVWDLAGIFNGVMTLPNIYMIIKCCKESSIYIN